jgi:hypothetical protein
MKKISPLTAVTIFSLAFLLSSCEVVEGIFKAGMGFGIFAVIAVLVVIVAIIVKVRKK